MCCNRIPLNRGGKQLVQVLHAPNCVKWTQLTEGFGKSMIPVFEEERIIIGSPAVKIVQGLPRWRQWVGGLQNSTIHRQIRVLEVNSPKMGEPLM